MEYEAALDDGTVLRFRPIRAEDKERLRQGFTQLSPESRYRRFFRLLDELSPQQLEYLTNVDHENHDAWVALLKDVKGQPGIGVARWIRLPDQAEVAEGAVTVIDPYHGRGIGRTLLWLAARSAIEKGVKSIRAFVLAENREALMLLRSLGAVLGPVESGVVEVNIPLPGDASELDGTPAPLILKATAAGELDTHVDDRLVATHFKERDPAARVTSGKDG